MRRVEPEIAKQIEAVQLYLDDVRDVCRILADSGRRLEIKIDNWELDSIDELIQVAEHQRTASIIRIYSFPTTHFMFDISVSVGENALAWVRVSHPNATLIGMATQVEERLNRCRVPKSDAPLSSLERAEHDVIVFERRPAQVRHGGSGAPAVSSGVSGATNVYQGPVTQQSGSGDVTSIVSSGSGSQNVGSGHQSLAGQGALLPATSLGRVGSVLRFRLERQLRQLLLL